MTKSLFRLVIGATLSFQQLVEIQPSLSSDLLIGATLTFKGFLLYVTHEDPLK